MVNCWKIVLFYVFQVFYILHILLQLNKEVNSIHVRTTDFKNARWGSCSRPSLGLPRPIQCTCPGCLQRTGCWAVAFFSFLNYFLLFKFYFSIAVYIQYYVVLPSVCSIVIRWSYALQSVLPDISSTHLSQSYWPYLLRCILHPCDYFVTTNLSFLSHLLSWLNPPTISPLTTISLFSVSMSLFQDCLPPCLENCL